MTGHNFVRPPGGFLRDLSAAKRQLIEDQFPTVSVDAVAKEAGFYLLWREAIAETPAPGEARNELADILEQIGRLRALVEPTNRPIGRLVSVASPLRGDPMNELLEALCRAEAPIERTIDALPKGRATTARQRLTAALARIVANAGLVVNAKPNGPLCQLMGHVLEDVGEQASDIRKIVEPVAAKWKNMPQLEG